jgi:predicted ATPase/signal transduction histidine kinase/tRNA A-37 threonylcarbamoyl transferase component Bud32
MITLTGYNILEQIYDSANSQVYRAIREQDQLPVILKILKQDYPTPQELTRYKQEYEIIRHLDFEGVTKVYGLESYQRTLVMIIEDFGALSFKKLLQQQPEKRLSLSQFLDFALQITSIISSIHYHHIIHKDINPSNIILNPQTNIVKIIDFGISTQLNRENPLVKNPHLLEGTLAYLSPEQTGRMNRFLDYRTDFYSLGVTFYELITGQLPFISHDPLELIHCHLAKIPVSPHEINLDIPPIVSDIIMTLMAKTAEDRYQTTLGLITDLKFCLSQLVNTGKIAGFTLKQNDRSSQFQIPQKLYGRENEINILMESFEEITQGKTEMILVSGYSGIGKSSLVNEIHKPIVRQKGIFISGKFDQLQRDIPYLPLIQAFQGLIRQLLTESDAKIHFWRDKIMTALGNYIQMIIDVIPEVELIVGKQNIITDGTLTGKENQFYLVLQKFVNVFTQSEHPLVIFLDDLQWVDSGSLKFIELLITSPQSQYLLLIGAYRDHEVSQSHPLMLALEAIADAKVNVKNIGVKNLDLATINQIIADTMKCSLDESYPLAELCLQKTDGNPFFLNQLLLSLYRDNLITFNSNIGKWQWDLSQINALAITNNVVDLMLDKLRKLTAKTQGILKIAAAIGNRFDLEVLAKVNQTSLSETASDLWEVLAEGLVIPVDESYKIPLLFSEEEFQENIQVNYRFLHDRVQQAAYTLLSANQQQETHLKIGKLLLQNTPDRDFLSHIFDIVNHLNEGRSLITDEQELINLARLNLRAGQKAKATAAFESAFHYLQIGIEILSSFSLVNGRGGTARDIWAQEYELILNLYQEGVESAHLSLHFEQMEIWSEIVLKEAKTILEKVKIYEVKIQAYIAQNRLKESIDTALEVLEFLGVNFPIQPDFLDIQNAIAATTSNLKNQSLDELLALPEMVDSQHLAAMRILGNVSSAFYIGKPELYPLVVLKQVDLSVKYGNAANSAYAYATYGLILCATETDIDFGDRMGNLALNLLDKFQVLSLKAKVFNLVYPFVRVWKQDIKDSLKPLLEGYHSGIDTGDLEFAAYCIYNHCSFRYLAGNRLSDVAQTMAIYGEAISQIKQETALNFHNIYWQTVLNLMGENENPCVLIGKVYNEEVMLPIHIAANDQYAIAAFYINKLILNYLCGKYPQAVNISNHTIPYLNATAGYPLFALYYFYDSLTQLAVYSQADPTEQIEIITKVNNNQEKLQNWANHADMNYQHKYDLVAAELARIAGEKWQASELYEQAIAGAKKHQYLQEEAIAYELAAIFYLTQGRKKIAQIYLKEAHYSYDYWGAKVKVQDLENRYPQIFPRQTSANSLINTTISSNGTQTATLDLNSILKASQTLSSAIQLETLLTKMMEIIIENAGANQGYLILHQENQWTIKAVAEIGSEQITRLQSLELNNLLGISLPESILKYVMRTQENIVLNNAINEGNFTEDTYIIQQQPKSVLCTPLIHQGIMIGILYLENKLTTKAFTPERIEILHLLCSQAAISLENATLYQTLEQKVIERTAELSQTLENLRATQNQLIEAEKMAALGNLVAGVAHEISTPVGTSITVTSFLADQTESFIKVCQEGQLKRSILNDYLKLANESSQIILNNLQRAGGLVNSFKQVAVDQTRLEQRIFNVKGYIEEILVSLQPEIKHKQHSFHVTGDDNLTINSYPGALSQIVTNLVMNSINHAYHHHKQGLLSFNIQKQGERLLLQYQDDGCGIPPENLSKIFEPFFTTARNEGGTGLGLHIIYNLVNQTLKGTIICQSEVGVGTKFIIDLPL